MKIQAKLITLILSIAMVVTSISTAFAADTTEEGKAIKVVSIGASETNGFGFEDYVFDENDFIGWKHAPEGIYPSKIANFFKNKLGTEVSLDQLAISGARSEEFRILLDNNYYGDSYTKWRFYDPDDLTDISWKNWLVGLEPEKTLAASRAAAQKSVKEADVISVCLGANTFGSYLTTRLTSDGLLDGDTLDLIEDEKIKKDAESILDDANMKAMIALLRGFLGDDASAFVQKCMDTIVYAYAGYCESMGKILEYIHKNNPDAQVVISSIPNLGGDLNIKYTNMLGQKSSLPVNSAWNLMTSRANSYVEELATNYGYQFVNISDVEVKRLTSLLTDYKGDPKTISDGLKTIIMYYQSDDYVELEDGEWYDTFTYTVLNAIKKSGKKLSDAEEAEVYDAAFDAVTRYFKAAHESGAIMIDDLLEDGFDFDKLNEEVSKEGYVLADMAARRALGEEGYTDFDIDKAVEEFLEKSGMASIAYLWIDATYGSGVFPHPNAAGHEIFYSEIEKVLKSEEACPHKWTKMEGVKKATYLQSGYTGDKRCLVCGHLESGKYIPSLKYKIKSSTLPCKVKQSFKVASNISIAKGDAVASVKSSNSKIAKVSGTSVKGVKKGTATITVKMKKNSNTYKFKVKVQKGAVKCSKLTTKLGSKITLAKGKKASIGASKAPITCKYGITYKSSKKKVATVSKKGVITAKKKGTAKITVKCKGKKKTITVTVK